MKLKILWMYHDLLDLYGDKGNLHVLEYRAKKRHIDCQIDTCTIGEKKNLKDYDLIFLGGGADREQTLLYRDLISRKSQFQQALDAKTNFLLVCGGYQLFGKYYKDQDGNIIEGLGFFDYYTESSDRSHRCIGNIVTSVTIEQQTITVVGFENHGGQTQNILTPFGKVLYGHGNCYQSQFEGFMNQQVIGTYIHGPLLPKNPKLADAIILRALKRNYQIETLESLDDTLENQAHDKLIKRLKIKL